MNFTHNGIDYTITNEQGHAFHIVDETGFSLVVIECVDHELCSASYFDPDRGLVDRLFFHHRDFINNLDVAKQAILEIGQ